MEHLNPGRMRILLKAFASRVAAGAVLSAALTAGSLGLTAAAASACPNPDCVRGVPPVTALAMECTDSSCVSGMPAAAASRPGTRVTGRAGHGGPGAWAVGGVSTAASAARTHASTSTSISGGGGGLCGTPTTPECPLS